ncbi:transmembrane protein 201-like [Centruroides sculpturatus]|uniref:transmembrane protein 201-like n=1 Tax=Centruroides sculpturatus TaxID=218467 RepID=UPI000C6CF750|nr:transmembrane protein 201-like [Centruroides sculpturatus]
MSLRAHPQIQYLLNAKPHFPIRVNCWFCRQNTVVPFGNSNCWDCPNCEQYNGFQEDNDYNKPIPAQYDESLNFPVTGVPANGYKFSTKSALCMDCNRNQQIKIKLLSEFVPFNEDSFSEEIDAYHCQLEKAYHLCHWCDIKVQNILSKQDSELLATLPTDLIRNSRETSESLPSISSQRVHICVHGLTVISLLCLMSLLLCGIFELQEDSDHQFIPLTWKTISFLPTASTLTVIGLLTAVGAILFAGRNKLRRIDATVALVWVVLQAVYSTIIDDLIPAADLHLMRPIIIFLTLIISIIGYVWRFTNNTENRIWMSKRRGKRPLVNRTIIDKPPADPSAIYLYKKISKKQPAKDVVDAIDQKLDAIQITSGKMNFKNLEKLSCKSLRSNFPLIRPTRFTSQQFRQASWTGGNYWSFSNEKSSSSVAGNSSLGLITPPPSVCSSQESSSASHAESTCEEEWHCESYETRILTWPPSIAKDKSVQWESETSRSNTSNMSQSQHHFQNSVKAKSNSPQTSHIFGPFSYKVAFVSVIANIILLIYYVILPWVN